MGPIGVVVSKEPKTLAQMDSYCRR
uniref:Uncharacterized protein n=1 Tax=Arundo donax TaxID=35708 RepID=A0A0A8ZGK6_ARUDO